MKIILYASEEVNKFEPLAGQVPACMLPVANRPVMEHLVEMLARQNVKHIYTSLFSQAGQVESHFQSGRRWNVTMDYDVMRSPLGSAGAIGRFRQGLDETFLFLPACMLIDLDLATALQDHQAQGNAATMLTARGGQPTGAYLFEPEVLSLIPARERFDIADLLALLRAGGHSIGAHEIDGYWNPMGSFKEYGQAQADLLNALSHGEGGAIEHGPFRHYRVQGRQIRPGIWVGRQSTIHPSARLIPPVLIGESVQVGKDVDLGPNAVLGNHVIIDDGATIRESVIFNSTYAGQYVNIERRAIRHNQVIDLDSGISLRLTDRFLLDYLAPDSNRPLELAASRLTGAVLLVLALPFLLVAAALVWLATGKVWEKTTFLKQQPGANGLQHGGQTHAYRLLRFNARRKDGAMPALIRWMDQWDLLRLPELWNVACGELYLVGAHPHSVHAAMTGAEPWQEPLRQAQPGLTGLWFVQSGRYDDPVEVQIVDVYYTATRTPQNDLRLALKTPAALVRRARECRPPESGDAAPVGLDGSPATAPAAQPQYSSLFWRWRGANRERQ